MIETFLQIGNSCTYLYFTSASHVDLLHSACIFRKIILIKNKLPNLFSTKLLKSSWNLIIRMVNALFGYQSQITKLSIVFFFLCCSKWLKNFLWLVILTHFYAYSSTSNVDLSHSSCTRLKITSGNNSNWEGAFYQSE